MSCACVVQRRWRSDLNKVVSSSNFEARGWHPSEDEDDWDIYWASTSSIAQLFSQSSLFKLHPGQLVNHFPNHYELTHKDLLVKNINRHRRRMQKAGDHTLPPIIPETFVLPQDYALFVEAFKKQQGSSSTFILKPARKAQGKGIFLINKLSQVRQQAATTAAAPTAAAGSSKAAAVPSVFLPSGSASSRSTLPTAPAMRPALEDSVVSRYIDNPLLVLGGKKFDLRLYVLVPSFKPLVAYLSSLGFARFSTMRYTRELAELDNQFVHLTNVAVQKQQQQHNTSHGNKWPLQDLRLHLEATHGHAATAQLFADIQALVVHTLKSVQPVMINDPHCFEPYGFDVLIDDTLQPWLIEVNASPSMTSTTAADRLLKWQVVHDALSIVVPPQQQQRQPQQQQGSTSISTDTGSSPLKPAAGKQAAQQHSRQPYPCAAGCMQLIHTEAQESSSKKAKRARKLPGKPNKDAVTGSTVAAAAHKRAVLRG